MSEYRQGLRRFELILKAQFLELTLNESRDGCPVFTPNIDLSRGSIREEDVKLIEPYIVDDDVTPVRVPDGENTSGEDDT
jgi:hypothetical protein